MALLDSHVFRGLASFVFSLAVVLCPGRSSGDVAASELTVELGVSGVWKLGHAVPARITLPPELAGQAQYVVFESIDGDGVNVRYQQKISGVSSENSDFWMTVRIGRNKTPLSVRVYDDEPSEGEPVASGQLLGDEVVGLPSDQRLVLVLGETMGLEEVVRSSVEGGASFTIAQVSQAKGLPIDWRTLAGYDLAVLSSAGDELINSLTEPQIACLDTWVRRGGRSIVCLGTGEPLPEILLKWIPGEVEGLINVRNPGAIEALVPTEFPLRNLAVNRIGFPAGEVPPAEILLALRSGNQSLPWWISTAYGHGKIDVIASDLANDTLAQWPDRNLLWKKLVGDSLGANRGDESPLAKNVSDTSYLGYDDLAGQLRATLDVFGGVRVVSFGQLAAVLLGILVIVGPVDYFVSVRWLGRPQFSWFFAGAVLVAACIALTWFYLSIRPNEIRVNTAQIIDIDTRSGDVNGSLWAHVYSGTARTVDVQVVDNQAESVGATLQLDWQPLPGRGLGGLKSMQSLSSGMPAYSVIASSGESNAVSVQGVGVPAAGTKCFSSTWLSHTEIVGQSELQELDVADQLSGQLVNPLSVDLREPALFYHNWYYSLDSRIPAGGSFTIAPDRIPQGITRRLNRRRVIDDADMITPWQPADRGNLDRLLELMMFYSAANGPTYTSLHHRFHHQLDHSHLMDSDLAVLIARVDDPWASVQVDAGGQGGVEVVQETDRAWCRILIPVKPPERELSRFRADGSSR
ncbi:MAG TPA: hypothetical protein DDW52_00700 [Planctomycetaceae bacterium]|nr:hypothetical protein [Planctomycetaceae bacterium]